MVINKSIEITALNKNGNEFNISLTISRSNQNDKPVFIAFIRDISDKKRSEAELEMRSKQLQSSNEQLLQFAHAASHDMKEPVRKILLYLGRIETEFPGGFPEKANTYLSKIENASHRLWNIVEGFLNYSNVNTFKEEFETIDMENLIKNIENDLELIIADKEAMIKYSVFPSLKGIPFLIYQLLYNLILNALKFSRKGVSPEILITGENAITVLNGQNKEVPVVIIKVIDNGIGFSPENNERIFKTFSRLNAHDQFEGTGLGLALCKSIVDRHNGEIVAEGQPGVGATFTITLPGRIN